MSYVISLDAWVITIVRNKICSLISCHSCTSPPGWSPSPCGSRRFHLSILSTVLSASFPTGVCSAYIHSSVSWKVMIIAVSLVIILPNKWRWESGFFVGEWIASRKEILPSCFWCQHVWTVQKVFATILRLLLCFWHSFCKDVECRVGEVVLYAYMSVLKESRFKVHSLHSLRH